MLERFAIVAALREIASLLELRGASRFKARAFARGARTLEASRMRVDELVETGHLRELPGIGPALAHQIEELHRTGRSDLLDDLRRGLPAAVLELAQVPGIGLHALQKLHDAGIGGVMELRRAAEAGKLRDVEGFGATKEARVLAALDRYEAKAPPLRLADALRLADSLTTELRTAKGVEEVHLAGEARRAMEMCDGLLLIIEARRPEHVLERVTSSIHAGSVARRDDRSVLLRLTDGTRVTLRACTREELPTLLVHGVATPAHWQRLEARAEQRGLRLSPDALCDGRGKRIALETDHDLYERLGLSWVPPEMREDSGEIERAMRRTPFDLVDAADVRGYVHCHTTWSDGAASIEDMARAAEALGATYVTITDHSANAHYARGLDVDRLRRQWDEIAEVQERVSIRILRGTEADILADGAIDWPDAILDELDVVIASIHARYRQDEAKMTERVLRAMRHPVFKIWGHPLGRLVSSRPPIPLRVEEVLDAIAESNAAVEVNGDPYRLDFEPRWIREARARGIPLVLGVDAHSTDAFGYLRYAVGLARRAGAAPADILNTRSANAFARAVKRAGKAK